MRNILPHELRNYFAAVNLTGLLPVVFQRGGKLLAEDVFKFNVPLVLLDFFIRHGPTEADEPGYGQLVFSLHQGHC